MKKQEIIDTGLEQGLELYQIEQGIMAVLGIDKKEFFLMNDFPVSKIYEIQKVFFDLSHGKPKEYIFEIANFYGRDFFVDARVLVPRDETEKLVEQLIFYTNLHLNPRETVYIDVGTGSGCIALSVLLELLPMKFFQSYALDISADALDVAKKNAEKYKINSEHLQFLQSDLLSCFADSTFPEQKNLLISANLPYIPEENPQGLEKSVQKFQPHSALFGGKNTGFELYEVFIKQIFSIKHIFRFRKVDVFLEIGFDQYEVSKNFFESLGVGFEYFEDFSKIKRVIHVTF